MSDLVRTLIFLCAAMDSGPPKDAFHDSDSEEIHVYTPRDKGKRRADDSFYNNVSAGKPGSSGSATDMGGHNRPSHTSSMDLDAPSVDENDSESTISMAISESSAYKRLMADASSSDEESLYESLYESAVDQDEKSKAATDDDVSRFPLSTRRLSIS